MDDLTSFIQIFKEDIIASAMIVIDKNFISAFVKSSFDSGVDLICQQFVHTVPVLDRFNSGICAIFLKTESGDAFNISLNIDFHFLPQVSGDYLNRVERTVEQSGDNFTLGAEKIEDRALEDMFHRFKIALTFGDDKIDAVELVKKFFL